MQGAGAASSAVGSIFAAQSQKLGLKLDAYFADLNAQGAAEDARRALEKGQWEEGNSRLLTARLKGSQRASMAANGVDLSTGSALDNLVTTDLMGEVDAQTIRVNAAREAAGYRTQASNARGQGVMARSAASAISPLLAGATSLIDSAGKIGSDWYAMKRSGALGGNRRGGAPPPVWGEPGHEGYHGGMLAAFGGR